MRAQPGFDQQSATAGKSSQSIDYLVLLHDLKNYRNVVSHGGGLHPKEYIKQNRSLMQALGSLLQDADFLSHWVVGYLREVYAKSDRNYESQVSISRGNELEYDPNCSPITSTFMERGHLYLFIERNEQFVPVQDLHPYIVREYCPQCQQDQMFFFNGSPDKPTAYHSHRCGHLVDFPDRRDDLARFRDLKSWRADNWNHESPALQTDQDRFERIVRDYIDNISKTGEQLPEAREKLMMIARAMQVGDAVATAILSSVEAEAEAPARPDSEPAVDVPSAEVVPPPDARQVESDPEEELAERPTPEETSARAAAPRDGRPLPLDTQQKDDPASGSSPTPAPPKAPVESEQAAKELDVDRVVQLGPGPHRIAALDAGDGLVAVIGRRRLLLIEDGQEKPLPILDNPARLARGTGHGCFMVGCWDGTLAALSTTEIRWSRQLDGTIGDLCPAPNGRWWAVGTWAGEFLLVDELGTQYWSQRTDEGIHRLFVDPTASHILRADLASRVSMHDTNGNILWGDTLDGLAQAVAWSGAGGLAIATQRTTHFYGPQGQSLGSIEEADDLLVCATDRSSGSYCLLTSDGTLKRVTPHSNRDRFDIRVDEAHQLGCVDICATGPDGNLALLARDETGQVLRLVRTGDATSRVFRLKTAARSLIWGSHSCWLWLLDEHEGLMGYRDREVTRGMAPAQLSVECMTPSMLGGIYQLLELKICNTGERRAKAVVLDLEGDFKAAGLPTEIEDLSSGHEILFQISMRPEAEGLVPITARIAFEDEIDGATKKQLILHLEVTGS